MRKRLRLTVIGLVTFLLAAVGFLVGHSMWEQHMRDIAQTGLEFLPGVSQHIQDFHRVKMQDGRKVWEVAADDAQYREDDKTVVVRGASVRLFLKDGRVLELKGDEGRLTLDRREIARVDLEGDIQLTFDDYVVRTQRATYDHEHQLISTPGAVEISGRALELHGDRMEVEVQSERLRLLHNITMQVQPALFTQGGGNAPF